MRTAKLVIPFDRHGDNAWLRITTDDNEQMYYMKKLGKVIHMYKCSDNSRFMVELTNGIHCLTCRVVCFHERVIYKLKAKGKI